MPATARLTRAATLAEELLDPGCYPHAAGEVELVETHISWVFLAGEYAYKVKKPVRLPFLDFGSLAERHFYCLEEVRLNRRTAPQIYLDVVPIAGTPARIGGAGAPRDYAVRMRRFPQQALLERIAREGRLEPAYVDSLADELVRLHAAAAVAGDRADQGTPERIRAAAAANFEEILALAPPPGLIPALEELRTWTRLACAELAWRFAERKSQGFVRECHGDLHLGNVVMLDGRAVIFDCVEFSAGLRWIDVMSDVAFVFMDLAHHGHSRLAYRLLDRYLEATGDHAGLDVLRFYVVYRAMVRAKVALARARQVEEGSWRQQRSLWELERYVALAGRLSRREPPVLMLMHGFSASGKTVASQRLLEALGAIRLRSDVERKRLHGLGAHDRAADPASLYAPGETERTYARLAELARGVLAAGYPVVVDATFLHRPERDAFRQVAGEARAAFEMVSCVTRPGTLRERIERRLRKGDDASDADLAVLERQLAAHDPLDDEERMHSTLLDTTCESEWRGAIASLARRFRMPMDVPGPRSQPC
jgi:aminoglycoside phosphotransferase family enzyme/predicted kinase